MARRFRKPTGPAAGILVGAVAGLLVAAVVVAAGWDPDDDGPAAEPARTDPAAVADLLDAWERRRAGTYVLEARFRRTLEGRSGLSSTVVTAQRPPDRLVSQGGSIDGRVEGRKVSCTTTSTGKPRCVDEGPAPAYDEDVTQAREDLAGYVEGDRPVYLVDRVDGCFRLRLALAAPPALREYGETARLCFDEETGALVRSVVTREDGEDVTELVKLRTEVSDGDFALPAEPAERPGAG